MICTLTDTNIKPHYHPARSGDIYASVASVDYARSLLGFELDYPFEAGLELTYEWFRQQQDIKDS